MNSRQLSDARVRPCQAEGEVREKRLGWPSKAPEDSEAVPRPLVFLDIDGVLVTDVSLQVGGAKCADWGCVSNLNTLVESSDAEIVISSSWRMAHSIDFIRATLCVAGFRWPDRIVGVTEHLHYRIENGRIAGRAERCDEIWAWLSNDPRERFVILDDDFEAEIAGHFVRTPADKGLGAEHVSCALSILRPSSEQ